MELGRHRGAGTDGVVDDAVVGEVRLELAEQLRQPGRRATGRDQHRRERGEHVVGIVPPRQIQFAEVASLPGPARHQVGAVVDVEARKQFALRAEPGHVEVLGRRSGHAGPDEPAGKIGQHVDIDGSV